MPNTNEWLFDAIWDLSDRAQEAKLPELANKLEEAMDIYLAEASRNPVGFVDFQSRRDAQAHECTTGMVRENVRAAKILNALLAEFRLQNESTKAQRNYGYQSSLKFVSTKTNARFAWPL